MAAITARLETPGAKLEREARPELREHAPDAQAAKASEAVKGEFAPKRRGSGDAVRAAFEKTGFDDFNKKWKQAPPGVEVTPNTSGRGTWIEKWVSPKTGK